MAGALGGGSAHQQRLVAERKWRLGMHARGHPSAIMAELFRVLQVRSAERCASTHLLGLHLVC